MTAIRDIIKDSERCITENIDEKYQSDVLGRLKGRADTVVFPVSTEEVRRNQPGRLHGAGQRRDRFRYVPDEANSRIG